MREGVLIVFWLKPGSPTQAHNRFRWRIYGRDTSSWKGKYAYHRPGYLEAVPHVRLYSGIVILRPRDEAGLARIVNEEGGMLLTRVVRLTPHDDRTLSGTAKDAAQAKA